MATPHIPVANFFKRPLSKNYQLSPDGSKIAFCKLSEGAEGRYNLFVQEGVTGKPRPVTAETDRDIGDYFWKGNKYLVCTLPSEKPNRLHLYRVNATSDKVEPPLDLTPFPNAGASVIDTLEGISDTDILIALITFNDGTVALGDACRVNVFRPKRRKIDIVCKADFNVFAWITDNAGCVRAAFGKDDQETILCVRPDEKSDFEPVQKYGFTDSIVPESLFFDEDNKYLYAISNIGRDKTAVIKVDPATWTELECLYEHPVVDVDRLAFSSARKVLTYASCYPDKACRKIFDDKTRLIFDAVAKACPDSVVDIVSSDRVETKFIIKVASDRSPPCPYLHEVATGKLTKLADVAPCLHAKELAPVTPIELESRDGLTIRGYLTLPTDREAKNLPAVINVHSGPWWRVHWHWEYGTDNERDECQFLANRGYAVLQLNFRGSFGYGKEFWMKGFKQFGRAMQDDLTDGVKWLINQGYVDPKRIAVYGKSYGGYAALAGATFTPELYKAAISYCGESNLLFTFMGDSPEIYTKVGNPITETSLLAAFSPALHADKIKVPLFIAHGDHDTNVERTESDQIVFGVHGVDVDYMIRANESHIFQKEQNVIDFYTAMEAFLAKHLGPLEGKKTPSK